MYSYGSPHMAAQKQDDQHERIFSSYARIQVVVLKTCLGRWTIGRSGERGSEISVLPARYDDDDGNRDKGTLRWQRFLKKRSCNLWNNLLRRVIDKTENYKRSWLCGNSVEKFNGIISECSKLLLKGTGSGMPRLEKVIL